MSRDFAVILAGGTGQRAGGSLPKQFQMLAGRPVLWWAIRAFEQYDPHMHHIVVMHPDYESVWRDMMALLPSEERPEVAMCGGGATRALSVAAGLKHAAAIAAENPADHDGSLVMIHDGARPLVDYDVIREAAEAVSSEVGAVPGIPLVDSIRTLEKDGTSSPADRSRYVAVQTPQVFMLRDICRAYSCCDLSDPLFTDDASVAQHAGISVKVTKGSPDNIKITLPRDFMLAAMILETRR